MGHLPGRLLAAITLMSLILPISRVGSQELPDVQEVPIPLTLQSPAGTTSIVVDARVDMSMILRELAAEPILAAITAPLNDETRRRLTEAGEDGWLSVEEAAAMQIELSFDAANLEATLAIPLELLGTQVLAVQKPRSFPDYPEAGTARFALGVPVWAQFTETRPREGDPRNEAEVRIAPGLSLFSWVLESEARVAHVDNGTDTEIESEIDNTRLVKTWEPAMARLQTGQIIQFARGLQASERLLGASVDNLQADLQQSLAPAVLDRPLTVEQPGTIDVFVNGRRSRSFPVQPGKYAVTDIPITSGINSVYIEYETESGETERYDLIVPHAGGLLDRGRFQYALSAGVEEETPDRPGGAGYLRYGVFRRLTVGALFDGSARGFQGGLDADTATALGEFSAAGYASVDPDETIGWAASGGYRFHLLGRRLLPLFSSSVQYQNPDFLRPGPTATASALEWQVNNSISQPLPGEVGVVISHVYRTYHSGSEPGSLLYAGLARSFGRRVSARINTFVDTGNPEEQWGAAITVSVRGASRAVTGDASYDVEANTVDAGGTATYNGAVDVTGSAALRNMSVENGTVSGANAALRGLHPRFEADGAVAVQLTETESPTEQQIDTVSYNLRGGVAGYYADGTFGVGAPHRSSFVLVAPTANLPTDHVYVARSGRNESVLRSGVLGAAVVGPYQPARPQSVSVSVPGVPADYSLGPTDFLVNPGYRSGTAIRIDVLRRLYVRGQLVDSQGDAVTYTVLDVAPTFELPETAVTSDDMPIGGEAFTDETGVFEIYGLIPGEYQALVRDGSGRSFAFTVPDAESPRVELDGIVLEEPEEREE